MIDHRFLATSTAAWNAHVLERIMAMMTDDGVFESGGGSAPGGDRYDGREEVVARFMAVWEAIPDVAFTAVTHCVAGDRGCSDMDVDRHHPHRGGDRETGR